MTDEIQPDSENQPSEMPLSEANPTPETEMEVHHHTHAGHHKKKWTDYFWEFLMLFLAVFCGFLAEYQLEHKIERDRAKELAKSFYEELKNDSVNAQIKVQNRIKQEESLRYLIGYFRDSSLTTTSKKFAINFEYGINFRSPGQFEPRTIMMEQLRNSGSLRYFKNETFQRLTGDLTVAVKNIADRQELETQNRVLYINPLLLKHYDYEFDNAIKKGKNNIFEATQAYEMSNDFIPFRINNPDKLDRQEIISILSFFNSNVISSTRQIHIQKYIETNAALLKVLREEYVLE